MFRVVRGGSLFQESAEGIVRLYSQNFRNDILDQQGRLRIQRVGESFNKYLYHFLPAEGSSTGPQELELRSTLLAFMFHSRCVGG